MSKVQVSMWVYEEDRDFIKVVAANEKETMAEIIHNVLKPKYEHYTKSLAGGAEQSI